MFFRINRIYVCAIADTCKSSVATMRFKKNIKKNYLQTHDFCARFAAQYEENNFQCIVLFHWLNIKNTCSSI